MPNLTPAPVRAYYGWLKRQRCAACGAHGLHDNPIEVAHVRGIYSHKTKQLTHRGHKGAQAWAALPLCRSCHSSLHSGNERLWLESRVPYHAQQTLTNVLTFLTEELYLAEAPTHETTP